MAQFYMVSSCYNVSICDMYKHKTRRSQISTLKSYPYNYKGMKDERNIRKLDR